MSKIAEKKAKEIAKKLEASQAYKFDNFSVVCGAIEGYDQAMQYLLEYLKHCSIFTDMNGNTRIDNDLLNILIEQFKNYMQNESEK